MKLQEVEVKKLGQQMVDFVDDVRDLANNGKYAHPIVGLVPAWTADNGEMVFFDAGEATTDRRIYVRLSSSWVLFAQILGNGAASNPGGPEGAVQFNSGGIFGGEQALVWSSSLGNSILAVTGAFHMMGTGNRIICRIESPSNQTRPTLFIDDVIGGVTSLVVNTRACISIGGGVFGSGAQGTISLSNGSKPDSITGSVQTYYDSIEDGLGVVPEVSGPHYLAANCVFSGGTVVVRNRGGSGSGVARIHMETRGGNENAIDFNSAEGAATRSVAHLYVSASSAQSAALSAGPFLAFASDQQSTAYMFIRQDNSVFTLTREQPYLVLGNIITVSSLGGTILKFNSGNHIEQNRSVLIYAPIITGQAAIGNSIASISNAATVYIEDAPAVTASANVINRYALWVDSGDVRIDANLIVGGSTLTPTPFVVNTRALFTTTGLGVASNNAGEITLLRGVVGTTGVTANTLSDGRTIRLSALGYFNTPLVVDNLTMRVKIGGQTVLTTGAQTPAASASTLGWKLDTLITCQTTGGAGTVIGQGDSEFHSSLVAKDFWQMVNSSTVVINTTGANAIEITAQWSGVSSASQLFLTNAMGELLN